MNAVNTTASMAAPEVRRLRDLSPQQWKSGIAAWLGWLFDGLDMDLYGLVALILPEPSDGQIPAQPVD